MDVAHFNKVAGKGKVEPTFKKVARVSVYNLVRYTPTNIRQNRLKNCRTYFYNSEFFKRPGKRGIRLFAYRTGCHDKTYVTVLGFGDYTKNLNSTVFCSCSCDHFKFVCEYALAELGASEHTYAWNQPPHIKNPNMAPQACKHILNCLDDALRRTRQFARLDKNKELEIDSPEIDIEPDLNKEYKPEKGPEKKPAPRKPIFLTPPQSPKPPEGPKPIFTPPPK